MSAAACREKCVLANRLYSLFQPRVDTDGSLTGTVGSNLCLCSNTCNYNVTSEQMVSAVELVTIPNADCRANPDPASGKSNNTCTNDNLLSAEHYCVFDNVGEQTVTDVVDSSTYTPSRTLATYECTSGYAPRTGANTQMECQYANRRSF
jgi:hypothetical protein